MVRVFLISLFILSFLRADLLDEKIKSLVTQKTYEKHFRLINKIFQSKDQFYLTKDRVDILKVIKVLKENGLLKLFFDEPKENFITFQTNSNPLFFMKIIEETLLDLGYNSFLTEEIKRENGSFVWTISFVSDYTLDPELFAKFLIKKECKITDIVREDKNRWRYVIDVDSAKLDAISLLPQEKMRLKRAIHDYWIKIDGGQKLSIASYGGNRWHPKIVVYDKDLKILKIYKQNKKTNWLVVYLPPNSYYIKISDIFTLDNLKYGLKVKVE